MLNYLITDERDIAILDWFLDEPEITFSSEDLVLDLNIPARDIEERLIHFTKFGLLKTKKRTKVAGVHYSSNLFNVNFQSPLYLGLKKFEDSLSLVIDDLSVK